MCVQEGEKKEMKRERIFSRDRDRPYSSFNQPYIHPINSIHPFVMSDFVASEEASSSPAVEREEDTTLANTEVVTKYQEAARIVNATLLEIVAAVSE